MYELEEATRNSALERLHTGVSKLMFSQGWQEALAFRSKFYAYSFHNTSLIWSQRPDATLVAGYRKWQSLKRQVRKGEKGIAIIAPLVKKVSAFAEETVAEKPLTFSGEWRSESDESRESRSQALFGFKIVYAFDVSQTEGEPVPTFQRPKLLLGDHEGLPRALDLLVAFATHKHISVRFDYDHPLALGAYSPSRKEIALRNDLPALQTFKTFVHEIAHALLHDSSSNRSSAELEAESCAFLVCYELGIDTSQYSFPYLASWTDSLEDLIAAGERASKAAHSVLSGLGHQPSLGLPLTLFK
jgi:antirestriction protein ArdC